MLEFIEQQQNKKEIELGESVDVFGGNAVVVSIGSY